MNKKNFSKLGMPLVIAICLATSALCNAKDGGEPPRMANSTFALTKKQEAQLLVKANNGDVKAAGRLAMYYDFVRFDTEKAIFWLRKAAQYGEARAQYNLGVRLATIPNQSSHDEAVYWLELASQNGEPLAAAVLKDLEKRNSSTPQMQTESDAQKDRNPQ